jgi:hypothetical protein
MEVEWWDLSSPAHLWQSLLGEVMSGVGQVTTVNDVLV